MNDEIKRDRGINNADPIYTRACVRCKCVFETNARGAALCEDCDPCTRLDADYDD